MVQTVHKIMIVSADLIVPTSDFVHALQRLVPALHPEDVTRGSAASLAIGRHIAGLAVQTFDLK